MSDSAQCTVRTLNDCARMSLAAIVVMLAIHSSTHSGYFATACHPAQGPTDCGTEGRAI